MMVQTHWVLSAYRGMAIDAIGIIPCHREVYTQFQRV